MREPVKLWMLYRPSAQAWFRKMKAWFRNMKAWFRDMKDWLLGIAENSYDPLLPTVPSGAQKIGFRHLLCGSL